MLQNCGGTRGNFGSASADLRRVLTFHTRIFRFLTSSMASRVHPSLLATWAYGKCVQSNVDPTRTPFLDRTRSPAGLPDLHCRRHTQSSGAKSSRRQVLAGWAKSIEPATGTQAALSQYRITPSHNYMGSRFWAWSDGQDRAFVAHKYAILRMVWRAQRFADHLAGSPTIRNRKILWKGRRKI